MKIEKTTNKLIGPRVESVIEVIEEGFDPIAFEGFVESLKLKYFKAHELLVNTKWQGNTPPPPSLWGNIVVPILMLDMARDIIGQPIYIHSTYRAEPYNSDIGGTQGSKHRAFMAIDCKSKTLSPANLAATIKGFRGVAIALPDGVSYEYAPVEGVETEPMVFIEEQNERDCVIFQGGVGIYDSFVHFDGRGFGANWWEAS